MAEAQAEERDMADAAQAERATKEKAKRTRSRRKAVEKPAEPSAKGPAPSEQDPVREPKPSQTASTKQESAKASDKAPTKAAAGARTRKPHTASAGTAKAAESPKAPQGDGEKIPLNHTGNKKSTATPHQPEQPSGGEKRRGGRRAAADKAASTLVVTELPPHAAEKQPTARKTPAAGRRAAKEVASKSVKPSASPELPKDGLNNDTGNEKTTQHNAPASIGRRRGAKASPGETSQDHGAAPDGGKPKRKKDNKNVTDIDNTPAPATEAPADRPTGADRTPEPGESGSTPMEAEPADAQTQKGSPAKPKGRGRHGRGKNNADNHTDTKNTPRLTDKKAEGGAPKGNASSTDNKNVSAKTPTDRPTKEEVGANAKNGGKKSNDNVTDNEKAPHGITIVSSPLRALPVPERAVPVEPLPLDELQPEVTDPLAGVEPLEELDREVLDDGEIPFSVGEAIESAVEASVPARSGASRHSRSRRGGRRHRRTTLQPEAPAQSIRVDVAPQAPRPAERPAAAPAPKRKEEKAATRRNPYSPTEFSSVEMMSSLRGFTPLGTLFVLMDVLKGHEEGLLHVNQLAQALGIGKPSLLAQLDNLEAAGLMRTISSSRAGRHIELLTPNMLPHPDLSVFPAGASGNLLAPAKNAPERGGQFSQKRLDILYKYLKDHRVEVTSIPDEGHLPKEVPQIAAFLGKYLVYVRPFYEMMKATLNDCREFRYSLAKLPSRDITHTLNFCHMLSAAKFLSSFTYRRAPQYSIVAQVNRTPAAINFLTGGWLEHYIRDKVISILTTHPATVSLPYAFMKNPNIILPTGENFELDFLLSVGDKIFWIEAKTGEYENYLAKYSRVSRVLGLTRSTSMLVSVEPLPAEDNLTVRYSLSCCNLDEFPDVFRINLVRELQQEAVQRAAMMA